MLKDARTRVTKRIGLAKHFGRLGPLSLPDETLGSEVAAHDTHVNETRHALLLLCGDVNHSSRTDGKSRRKGGLASLAFGVKGDRRGLR